MGKNGDSKANGGGDYIFPSLQESKRIEYEKKYSGIIDGVRFDISEEEKRTAERKKKCERKVSFGWVPAPVIGENCNECHSAENAESDIDGLGGNSSEEARETKETGMDEEIESLGRIEIVAPLDLINPLITVAEGMDFDPKEKENGGRGKENNDKKQTPSGTGEAGSQGSEQMAQSIEDRVKEPE